jgi:uncharacterized membrane protein
MGMVCQTTAEDPTERGVGVAETADIEARTAEIESKAADRLTFFSDAVVAIAITLLALELPVPQASTNTDVLHEVNADFNEYLAFFISFAVISAHWFGHHRVFRYADSVTASARRWNMLWLLMIVLTPFAARVISGDGAFQFRFILYASVQALAGLFFLLAVRALAKHGDLDPLAPADLLANSYQRLGAVTLMFLVSIPISLVTPYAYVCWIAIPFVGMLFRRLTRSKTRSA